MQQKTTEKERTSVQSAVIPEQNVEELNGTSVEEYEKAKQYFVKRPQKQNLTIRCQILSAIIRHE